MGAVFTKSKDQTWSIFASTLSWNESIYALTFIQSSGNKTVPIGVLTELVRWMSTSGGR